MDFKKDYYAILELNENASSVEIKKAYRKLAKKYHPDVNQGNLEYEEVTKGLNEAYGVIGNQENKFIYDQYRNSRKDNPNLQKDQNPAAPKSKNKRSFVKKSIVTTEKRIYIVGEIFIKYYALQDEVLTENINDIYFKIHPTQVTARVYEGDIYRNEEPPADVNTIFSNSQPSQFILTNTATEVIYENHKNFYELEIRNPIILNPTISDVTKHEGISYGTLSGDLYAFFEFKEEREVEVIVEECFGETGRKEENSDENNVYRRLEYYNSDCTTYWGPWIAEPIRQPSRATDHYDPSYNFTKQGFRKWHQSDATKGAGCGFIPTLLFLGFFLLILLPMFNPLTWLLILIALLLLLRNSGWFLNTIFRIGTLMLALFTLAAIWSLFMGNNHNIQSNAIDDGQEISTVRTEDNHNSETGNTSNEKDQIISHYRVWNDYSGNRYEGELKIFLSDYQSAKNDHNEMNMRIQSEADWSVIYNSILHNDRDRINLVYSLFDSIRNVKKLDRSQFAEMIVSCIQDIPYYIILPNDCSIQGQEDPFVRNFLNENPNFCLGNISYGVQTPGEFLGNLKGDCDTRVAILFEIFNHYNYKVAILGSSQFRHSILGIELSGEGLSKAHKGINYKMWETTSEGFRPGILAPEVSNLNYWNFYLTN